jgi:hypothetical protein
MSFVGHAIPISVHLWRRCAGIESQAANDACALSHGKGNRDPCQNAGSFFCALASHRISVCLLLHGALPL